MLSIGLVIEFIHMPIVVVGCVTTFVAVAEPNEGRTAANK